LSDPSHADGADVVATAETVLATLALSSSATPQITVFSPVSAVTAVASGHTAAFFYLCTRASIAARTFGGDIGNSVSRVPTACSIALAMAAIGGQMLTSAAPLAPYG